MNSILKKLVTQAGDSNQNSASADLADQFVALSENCHQFTPKKVQNLPADQQTSLIQDYGLDVNNMTALGKNLASAFRSGDNAGAQKILNDLSAVKKDGHSKFK